jgi:hypothetical protein
MRTPHIVHLPVQQRVALVTVFIILSLALLVTDVLGFCLDFMDVDIKAILVVSL